MVTTVFDSTYPDGYMPKYPTLPEDVGQYVPGRSYNLNNVVRHLGSVFESRMDGNTHVPAEWDKESGNVYFNTEYWKILVNGTADYILHQEIKGVSDEITNMSGEIDQRITREVSGVNERISNVNDNLQVQIDNVASSSTDILASVNPDIIFSDTPSLVNIISSINTGGNISSHIIAKDGVIIASASSSMLFVNDNVNSASDVIYNISAVINGKQRNDSIRLKVVGKIYYGSGKNPSSANTYYETPKENPQGTYIVNVRENGDNIFIDIPNSMTVNSFTVNDFNMPFIVVESSRPGYRCYKSVNTYDAGNITIVVR